MNIGDSRTLRFKEDIIVKEIIASTHAKNLENGEKVSKKIWQKMAERLGNDMNQMLAQGVKKTEIASFCAEVCLKYPLLLRFSGPYKALTRTILGNRVTLSLKRLSHRQNKKVSLP